jgi:hypothetical protein
MKLIIVLITLGLSISNFKNKFLEKSNIVGRKLSTINSKNFMLVGFSDYQETFVSGTRVSNCSLKFSMHFITNNSFPYYMKINVPISIQFANKTNFTPNTICELKNNMINKLKNWTYECKTDNFAIAVPNVSNITEVIPKINFSFYNDTNSTPYVIAEYDIEKSSIADKTINSLKEQNESIIYETFYLNKTIFEKNTTEFILKGNLSYNETQTYTYINLTLLGIEFNSSLTNNEIRFNPSGKIDDYLHGKMATKNGTYVLIYAPNGVNDHLSYPIPKQYINVLDFGNFQKLRSQNATNQLFFEGTLYALNKLKPYIRFNTTIYYNSLRNLEESNTTITANGTLADIDQIQNFAIYNVTYPDTANKNITFMSPPLNFEFSEDGATYEKINEEINIPSYVNLLQVGNISVERMGNIDDKIDKNTTSFSLYFDLSEDSILPIRNSSDAYLKYNPENNNTKQDEIKCVIQKYESYILICFPKKNVNTSINTIKIIINETSSSSNSRLRSLQSGTNRTILPPADAKGEINFAYTRINYKRSEGGLSAGAIVAIVLATVAAVVALGLAILFLNRMKASPPPIKNPSDLNIANSASNINN